LGQREMKDQRDRTAGAHPREDDHPSHSTSDALDFLRGGGKMGALMRNHRWEDTALSVPHSWPQSLRSALSICLGSGFQVAIYWGPQLALLYNDAWSDILGQKHPWALGRRGREVWPEIWETIGPMLSGVLSEGEATVSRDQLLAMHRRGFVEECYFDYTCSPIRDEAGKVGGIFNIAVETTFRVLGERRTRLLKDLGERTIGALSAEEACAMSTSALAADPADLPFCLLFLRHPQRPSELHLAGTSGIAPGTFAAQSFVDLCDETSGWPLARALSNGSDTLVEGLSERWGLPFPGGPWPEPCEQALLIPLPDMGQGDSPGVFVAGISPRLVLDAEYRAFLDRVAALTSTAISRARAYEAERFRAEALAELDRAKTVFFSNVSHEFRTPLTLMLGPLEDMLARPEEQAHPDTRALLQVVHRSGLRLQRLVNTLLDFSRIEAGRAQASFEPTDLSAFTAELASSFQSAMQRAGLQFTVECSAQLPPVFVDREMWEKVVLNLLSNAFKYTLEGAVTVSLMERDGRVELSVSDTGLGIAEEELPRLFERFHRIENTRGRTHEGTGIGLALVLELVKLHGGEVRVKSTPGIGSTFTVTLPFGSSHLPQHMIGAGKMLSSTADHTQAYVEEALRWLPEEHVSTDDVAPAPRVVSASAPRSRVLIADDNADMRDYVGRLLSSRYEVIAVANGQEALNTALAQTPDLILTDVMMPELDGFQLLAELRAHERTKILPVIMLSARAGEESRVEGLAAGADDYLVKPFTARELLARVDAHLSLARMRKEADLARRLSEERLTFALEAGGAVGTFNWNVREDRFYCDARFAQLFSVEPELAAAGAPLAGFVAAIHPDDRAMVSDKVQRALENGDYAAEYRVVQQDGSVRWVLVRGRCHSDASRNPTSFTGVVVDITPQVLARLELERMNKELEEFAYVASHDLQEPLRVVKIFTQLLLRHYVPSEPKAREYSDLIQRSVTRMEALIRDLLKYSSTVQREELPVGTADLSVSLSEAQTTLGSRLEESHAQVYSGPLPVVRGDAKQMAHVFQNLLSNAIKYRKADVPPEIHISAELSGDEWTIVVRDNGIGFEQQYAKKIFGLFKRLHKDEYPGTGLGLAICQRIVERYGGRMWAEGEPEQGASFFFALPAAQLQ
jgi:signal transduction histidine kinase